MNGDAIWQDDVTGSGMQRLGDDVMSKDFRWDSGGSATRTKCTKESEAMVWLKSAYPENNSFSSLLTVRRLWLSEVSKISDLKSGKGPNVSDEDIDRVREVKQEPESSKVEGMALA